MKTIKEKINRIIAEEIKYCKKNGFSKLSTCNYQNWDLVVWNYKTDIINGIRERGYKVSTSTNWGVLDIETRLKLK